MNKVPIICSLYRNEWKGPPLSPFFPVLWCLTRKIGTSLIATDWEKVTAHKPRSSGLVFLGSVFSGGRIGATFEQCSCPQGRAEVRTRVSSLEQPSTPLLVFTGPSLCSSRLSDPAPDTGGNRQQNRSSASGNPTGQRRPVWGARLACLWRGRSRPERGCEYLVLGSSLRIQTRWVWISVL